MLLGSRVVREARALRAALGFWRGSGVVRRHFRASSLAAHRLEEWGRRPRMGRWRKRHTPGTFPLPCIFRGIRGCERPRKHRACGGFLEPVPPREPAGHGRPRLHPRPRLRRAEPGSSGTAPVSKTTLWKQTRRRIVLRPQEIGRARPASPGGALCRGVRAIDQIFINSFLAWFLVIFCTSLHTNFAHILLDLFLRNSCVFVAVANDTIF